MITLITLIEHLQLYDIMERAFYVLILLKTMRSIYFIYLSIFTKLLLTL